MTENNVNQLRQTLSNHDCDKAVTGSIPKDVDVCFFFHDHVFFTILSMTPSISYENNIDFLSWIIFIFIYRLIHIYIYAFVFICVWIDKNLFISEYLYMYIYVFIYICLCIYI